MEEGAGLGPWHYLCCAVGSVLLQGLGTQSRRHNGKTCSLLLASLTHHCYLHFPHPPGDWSFSLTASALGTALLG